MYIGSQDSQEFHWLGCVDVRDVAGAHILLLESDEAEGRYLCTNGIFQFGDFARTVARLFPRFPVHRFTEETHPGLVSCKNAAKRLIDLGTVFTPIEDAIKDSVASLMMRGIISD